MAVAIEIVIKDTDFINWQKIWISAMPERGKAEIQEVFQGSLYRIIQFPHQEPWRLFGLRGFPSWSLSSAFMLFNQEWNSGLDVFISSAASVAEILLS